MPSSRSIATRYGTLTGVEHASFHPGGQPSFVVVSRPNVLDTPVGRLVPQHQDDDLRRPRVDALAFYEDGTLRSAPLQEQTEVRTPVGPMLAELVTFHPDGSLRRVFPLNGKLSGHYAWQDEIKLAAPLAIPTSVGRLEAKFISVQFFPSGAVKSLTLWPEETLTVPTPLGPVAARVGVAFHECGALRSVEPAAPLAVDTPVGRIQAFDNDPEGITGDVNSLAFTPQGALESLKTVTQGVAVRCAGVEKRFKPRLRINLCDELASDLTPLALAFQPGRVFLGPDAEEFSLADCSFAVEQVLSMATAIQYKCG